METKKLLIWDMDYNLGIFDNLSKELNPFGIEHRYVDEDDGDEPEEVGKGTGPVRRYVEVRPVLEHALRNLKNKSIASVIATKSADFFAQRCLQLAKVENYFERVFSFRPDASKGDSGEKNYDTIAEAMHVPLDRMPSDVLVISHTADDAPIESPDIVFLLDSESVSHDARITEDIVTLLMQRGVGDFSRGFKALQADAKNPLKLPRVVIKAHYMWGSQPTIEVVSAKTYTPDRVSF